MRLRPSETLNVPNCALPLRYSAAPDLERDNVRR